MIRTRTWVIIILSAAVILAGLSYYLLGLMGQGTVAEIIQDGEVIREIDLSRVAETYSFDVEWKDGGCNTVTVRPGAICVSEADCPDLICVHQGWLTDQAAPIVCMPHRLMIHIKNASGPDAVSQ